VNKLSREQQVLLRRYEDLSLVASVIARGPDAMQHAFSAHPDNHEPGRRSPLAVSQNIERALDQIRETFLPRQTRRVLREICVVDETERASGHQPEGAAAELPHFAQLDVIDRTVALLKEFYLDELVQRGADAKYVTPPLDLDTTEGGLETISAGLEDSLSETPGVITNEVNRLCDRFGEGVPAVEIADEAMAAASSRMVDHLETLHENPEVQTFGVHMRAIQQKFGDHVPTPSLSGAGLEL